MEQWEIDLRAKLNKELTDGYYQIGDSINGFVGGTGKQGYIEFEVALQKAARNYTYIPTGKGIESQIPKKDTYTELTEQDIIDKLEMEDNKYYTPSIEEFRVGFIYEKKEDNEWFNKIYEPYDNCLIGDLIFWIEAKIVRVKYLDQSDIESLGWKMSLVKIGNKEVDCYGLKSFIITSYVKDYILDISLLPIFKTQGPSRVFRGKIKNKSELEVLMKQLGIYEK